MAVGDVALSEDPVPERQDFSRGRVLNRAWGVRVQDLGVRVEAIASEGHC